MARGTPQPMEGLHGTGPPPFLNKTYDLVDDSSTNHIVSWGKGNNSFVVWDPQLFSLNLLPRYFKHSNFSSFVRQLNTYGFRKVDPDKWEFANEGFLRGKRHLLKNIKRRKTTNSQSQFEHQDLDPCVELGRFGVDAEIDMLRRDKQVLMGELVKLRQEQQNTTAYLKAIEQRLKETEMKQQKMMNFLVRAITNKSFVQQLIQQKDKRKELEEAISNKRRRPIDQGDLSYSAEFSELGSVGVRKDFVSEETESNYRKVEEFEDSELDRLALEMQRFRGASKNSEEGNLRKEERHYGGDGGLDQRFWEDLMNDGIEEKLGSSFGLEREDEEIKYI